MSELYEKLAAIEHERWADWQQYVFDQCRPVTYDNNGDQLHLVIPQELVERWGRQINTDYADLSEEEKQSDRDQVDRYWHLVDTRAELEACCAKLIENGISTGHGSSFTDLIDECIGNVLESRAGPWIPVEAEKMPVTTQMINVLDDADCVYACRYYNGNAESMETGDRIEGITHWQPIAEIPE